MKLESVVNSDECMCCGSKNNLTKHHAIPQRMKPKHNVQVTICNSCHKKIHSDDVEGLKGMVYKAQKIIQSASSKIMNLSAEEEQTSKKGNKK